MNHVMWDEMVIILVMFIAFLLNLACHNDKNIRESVIATAGRRLIMVAQFIIIAWLIWMVFEAGGSVLMRVEFFALLAWSGGSSMMSVDHIAHRWGREISELLKPNTTYERRKHPR